MRRCLIPIAFLLLAACDAGGTRATIRIDAAPEVRRRATSVEIIVLGGAAQRLVERRVYRVPQDREFPFEVELRPAAGEARHAFSVVVRAFEPADREEPFVGRLLVASYLAGGGVDYGVLLGLEDEPRDGGDRETDGGVP